MPSVHKTALVPYPAQAMFDLVATVPDYPSFLPWCGGARELERTATRQVASVQINFHGVRQSFTTENTLQSPQRIELALRDGPFSRLHGTWSFKPLQESACRIDFDLDYEMPGGLLARVLEPVFGRIAQTMVDSFVAEAERRGQPGMAAPVLPPAR